MVIVKFLINFVCKSVHNENAIISMLQCKVFMETQEFIAQSFLNYVIT